MIARNQVTGERVAITLYPGDEMLTPPCPRRRPAEIEDLADQLKVKRDLAIAEIATESLAFDSLTDAMNNPAWTDSWPEYLRPTESLVYHIDDIEEGIGSERLAADGPLHNTSTGKVYEIIEVGDPAGPVADEHHAARVRQRRVHGEQHRVHEHRPVADADLGHDGGDVPGTAPTEDRRADRQSMDGKPVKAGDNVFFTGDPYTVQEVFPSTG